MAIDLNQTLFDGRSWTGKDTGSVLDILDDSI